jgi:osmotically-inducible protein OsmY
VTNEIRVRPQATGTDVATQIAGVFRRSAQLDAHRIRVEMHGVTVSLFGTVRSWLERQEAERVAWGAPGVCEVENHITVTPEADLRLAPLEAASSTSATQKEV